MADGITKNNTHVKRSEEITIEPNGVPSDQKAIRGIRRHLLLVALCLATFIMGLDLTILATAVPTITSHFKALGDVSWYGSSYFMVISACNPLAGKFFQSFSPKWVSLVYTALFLVGSLVSAVAPSSAVVIGGRVIMGLGASGMLGGILAIIGLFIPKKDQPSFFGVVQGIYIVSEAVGPLVGGAFTAYVTWRWCFYLSLPIGGVTALLFLLIIPNHTDESSSQGSFAKRILEIDYLGFALFAGAIVMLLLALQFGGNAYRWDSSVVIGLLVGCGVTLLCFTTWQWNLQDKALIPPSIVCQKSVASAVLVALFGNGGFQVLVYYLPVWFQATKGKSAFSSGVMYLPTAIADLISAIVGGALISKAPHYNPFLLFGLVLFVLGAGLCTTFTIQTTEGKWISYQILVGAGSAFIIQVPVIAVQRVLPRSTVAIGSTTLVLAQSLSGAVFLAVADAIFQSQLRKILSETSLSSTTVDRVLGAGALGFRNFIHDRDLDTVSQSYNTALTRVFYVPVASGLASWISAWGLEWTKVAKDAEESPIHAEKQSRGFEQALS